MADIILEVVNPDPIELTAGISGPKGETGATGATGNGIASIVLNSDYTLTVTYTDGTTWTSGVIRGAAGRGISSTVLNSDYTLTINFDDGTSYTTPISIRGAQGEQGEKGDTGDTGATGATGNGIASATLNADYTLTLNFTDGTSWTSTSIRGATGVTGNGISSTVLNADYTLTITFTDGTTYTTPSIRGLQGAKGDTGDTGAKGDTGATGNGISSTVLNADYTLTITFTDGTSYTTPVIRGAQGAKGDKGDTGDEGDKGDKGDTGATGNGIASAVLNADYTLTLTFTNGTTYTTPSIRGEKGEKGDTTSAAWGTITGTLSTQTDLQTALDGKADDGDIPTKTSDLTNDSGFLTSHQSLSAYRTSAAQDEIDSGKQDTISDLATIRSGASAGATAVQPSAISGFKNITISASAPSSPTTNDFWMDTTNGLLKYYNGSAWCETEKGKEWTNVSVSASGWSSDSTVTGYSYKQTLSLSGCTADMMVIVPPFSGSGSLAAECNTVAGGLEIWSNSNSLALTIPIIKRVI